MNEMEVEHREPGIVLVLSVFTCGLYLMYWYYRMYEELTALTGETPTGMNYWVDFLLNILTCSLYGIWVDYKISLLLSEMQQRRGMRHAPDTAMAAVGLDIAAFITGFFTNFISSAIQQDQLNKLMKATNELPYRSPA